MFQFEEPVIVSALLSQTFDVVAEEVGCRRIRAAAAAAAAAAVAHGEESADAATEEQDDERGPMEVFINRHSTSAGNKRYYIQMHVSLAITFQGNNFTSNHSASGVLIYTLEWEQSWQCCCVKHLVTIYIFTFQIHI